MLKRIVFILACSLLAVFVVNAQVTTSSITGTITDDKGEPLIGATVTAIHQPSGTTYMTSTKKGGGFNLPGLRPGGPYKITIDFVGFKPFVEDGFSLVLGDAFNISTAMIPVTVDLSAVVISSAARRRAFQDKSGASTSIGPIQLSTLPTISRSITDYTRITPQANGTSFAGRDNRMNNMQVDGANLNNNFGLSGDLLPGGGNPISLDAYQEISVNVSPYDVRQSGFTGAGISAITKSGTNTFHGSAYGAYRDQSFNGTNVAGTKLAAPAKTNNKLYGLTVSGPIIKDKLFFFINAEVEKASRPGITFSPKGGSGNGTVSNVPIDSLAKLSDYLKSKYNFDPGAYDNFPNFDTKNRKLLAKLDWNISSVHKLTLKYSDYLSDDVNSPSGSGGINGASSQSAIVSYWGSYRFGLNAMGFNNVNYTIQDKVRSGSFELNSNFKGKFANQFLATFTKISSIKGHNGETFPFVDIMGMTPGSKNNYMSFGNEPFNGNNNQVINDVFNVTNNFTYFSGKHNFTFGATYEYQKVGNMFMPGSQGYYLFGSLNDFITNQAPKIYSINYSLIPGQEAVYGSNMKVGQLGVYFQDEFNPTARFKLTYGLRVDLPFYPEAPIENPAITALNLLDRNGNVVHYNSGKWPKSSPLFGPRVGFRWDIYGDKSLIIRGGSGIITGRVPFVYPAAIPNGSGMYTFGSLITNASDLSNFLFNPDPHAYNPQYNSSLDPTKFPTVAGTVAPGTFYAADPNYKFPQVWRTDFAVEKSLGKGWGVLLEALVTKDINDPTVRNSNQVMNADGIVVLGPTTRPRYSSTAARRVNSSVTNAAILENIKQGGSFVLTTQLSKSFSKGFYASLAYNYTLALEGAPNLGSQPASVWSAIFTSKTQNDIETAYSGFAVPHRVVGNLSYRFEYLKALATTVTLYYEGSSQGNYNYIYNGDINNDGNSADLMYIPNNPSEIQFSTFTSGGNTYTPQQQSDAFFNFVAQDKYLNKHKGQNAERNAARYPWYNRMDLNFQQEVFKNIGKTKNTLQFNVSVVNFLNLINHDWGIRKLYVVNNPLKLVTVTNGIPTFNLATFTPPGATQSRLVDRTFINQNTTSTTWGIQLGVKYIF
ncbi:MAG: TonB-dependent receptor [Bacteroidetes bacterium]|nr:TonB-dependent receptor [Bacteroidota bacterium]